MTTKAQQAEAQSRDEVARIKAQEDADYLKWLYNVDQILLNRVGVTHEDLPDCAYRDYFDGETNAYDMAMIAIDESGMTDCEE